MPDVCRPRWSFAGQVTTGVPTAKVSSEVFMPLKCSVSSITSASAISAVNASLPTRGSAVDPHDHRAAIPPQDSREELVHVGMNLEQILRTDVEVRVVRQSE